MEMIDGDENHAHEHYFPFEPQGYHFAPERATYLAKFARLRTGAGNKYLAYGKMLKPLDITCEKVVLNWFHYNCNKNSPEYNDSGELTVDAIVHSAWKYRNQSVGLFFANVSEKEQALLISLDVSSFDLMSERLAIRMITETNESELFVVGTEKKGKVDIPIPERSVVLLEVFPRK